MTEEAQFGLFLSIVIIGALMGNFLTGVAVGLVILIITTQLWGHES